MFIDRGDPHAPLRSEERNGSGQVKLHLNPAPPNGVGDGFCFGAIDISLNGVKNLS